VRSLILFAAAATLLANPLLAQTAPRWVVLVTDADGTFSYDAASLRPEGERKVVNTRTELSTPQATGLARIEATMLIDCATRQTGFAAAKALDSKGAEIQSRSTPLDQVEMRDAKPVSTDTDLLNKLC
jgi:hypothetical protein